MFLIIDITKLGTRTVTQNSWINDCSVIVTMTKKSWELNDQVIDGVYGEFRIIFHVHFFEKARTIGAYSSNTQR